MARQRGPNYSEIERYPQGYTPNRLINAVMERVGAETDRRLSEVMGVYPNRISHLRCKRSPMTAKVVLKMMDVSGLSLREVESLSGLRVSDILRSK